ncbi:restriction endonuclease subunit S [Intestinibacillus sp. NTUH-41-i26]|uniref:restriction endonuclease subunit S n=1 Tax=Intestinibacillus sp. NTUH-41-i26 TaxID=3079303 RepID=UPI002934F171|nr:restriction endonuclease subunit S [Intestinibacillus sp. NTUH-41-i26]WOC74108.1 restriction endonuclease subunit S [Intestinibacillus sp. NTUH-41-i26]
MDTKALRQKVLDLAIRGKLVPQDPNDEPASILLERIRQQKQQMVKDGKLKPKDIKNDTIIFVSEDNLHYEKLADGSIKCIEDEIPFDLPEGWAWSRMGSICEYITSGSRGWAQYYSDTGRLFLRMGNLSRDSFELRMDNLQRVDLPDNAEGTRTRVAENDLLFSITAEIGMLGLIPANFEEAYINQHVGLIRFLKEAQTKYFPYILMSAFCRDQYYTVQRGMKNSFRLDNIQNILTPVPPLGEQIRIAEKLSSIWLHIQQIDDESETATDIISKAKSKILDLAIRGQLIPQDPNDEPASVLLERIRAEKEALIKAGKIKRDKKESVIFRGEDNSYYEKIGDEIRCIDSKLPFDLPDSWIFVRLKHIGEIVGGGTPKTNITEYWDGNIPWLTPADFRGYEDMYVSAGARAITEIGLKFSSAQILPANSVLYSSRAPIGYIAIAANPISTNQGFKSVVPYDFAMSPYLYYSLKARTDDIVQRATGTTFKEISGSEMAETIIPLPPIKEQKRVFEKVSQLFEIITAIEKSLN